jgi:hypothetical protein
MPFKLIFEARYLSHGFSPLDDPLTLLAYLRPLPELLKYLLLPVLPLLDEPLLVYLILIVHASARRLGLLGLEVSLPGLALVEEVVAEGLRVIRVRTPVLGRAPR